MLNLYAKSILGPHNRVNLYRGCVHNCIYCDSRSDVYKVTNFENIGVKDNAMEIFEKELSKKRKRSMIVTGSMCDPYLPIERDLKLTRKMLEIISKFRFGVSLLTKSDLILRDIDLIEKINQQFGALVCMTVTTYNDDLCLQIERNVIPTSLRFACLEQFVKRGIPTGIWMGPILPFINDNEDNITRIVNRCAEIGIKYIVVFEFGTTKRSGSEQYFYKCLDNFFPGLKQKYINTYGNQYNCISPNASKLWEIFKNLCAKHNIIYDLNQIMNQFKQQKDYEQLTII
ncbi:MAG: radical SAM protein [Bacilli bacterium]